jgi:hypothetical protein
MNSSGTTPFEALLYVSVEIFFQLRKIFILLRINFFANFMLLILSIKCQNISFIKKGHEIDIAKKKRGTFPCFLGARCPRPRQPQNPEPCTRQNKQGNPPLASNIELDHFVQEKKAFNFSILCKYQYFVIVFTYFESSSQCDHFPVKFIRFR